MNPYLLFSALRARLGLFALALFTTLAAAVALSRWLPPSYRATVSMLVAEQTPTSGFVAPQERTAYLQTQADIVASERVARRVLDTLKLAQNAEAKAAYAEAGSPGSFDEWLIAGLQRGLKVETAQSNVIRISFDAADPKVAAAAVDAFAKAFVDATHDLRSQNARKSDELFEERLAVLRTDLQQAQANLTNYQREHGFVSADEAADIENARLAELSSQLVKAQDQTLELHSRQQQARAFTAKGAPLERLQDVQANSQVQRLSSELLQGETRLQDLALQYGVNYPLYQRQAAENRSRRAALDAEVRKVVAGIETAVEQGRRREVDLAAAIEAQRARLLELKAGRNELAQLVRNVDTAQKTYDAAVQKFVIDVAEHRVEQAHVSMLSPAVVPREARQPRLALNVAVALVVGVLLGLAIVVAMEMADRRVRSDMDLRLGMSVPVPMLGVMSKWTPAQALPGRPRGWPQILPDMS